MFLMWHKITLYLDNKTDQVKQLTFCIIHFLPNPGRILTASTFAAHSMPTLTGFSRKCGILHKRSSVYLWSFMYSKEIFYDGEIIFHWRSSLFWTFTSTVHVCGWICSLNAFVGTFYQWPYVQRISDREIIFNWRSLLFGHLRMCVGWLCGLNTFVAIFYLRGAIFYLWSCVASKK